MKTSKIALIIYTICCVLAIIADVFRLEALKLFTIPLIIPALFFYYFIEIKKLNFLICLFFLFNFIGDAIGIMNFDNEIKFIMFPFFISNTIIVFLMFKNLEKFKFNFLNIVSLLIIGSFLFYVWLFVIDLFTFSEGSIKIQVIVFGFSLFSMIFLASYNTIWRINISNLYLMVYGTCVLISDVFYITFNFQNQLVILDYIHFTCQIFSYFFFVKYILLRETHFINKQLIS